MTKIQVFSKPGCIQCVSTIARLQARGFVQGKDYDYLDVTKQDEHMEAALATGIKSMPIVVVSKNSIVEKWGGFNPDKLDALTVMERI